ncbi:hypothetical protein J7426_11240 [Tropicibacter sp. R16_0]|uniref:hypothetical protein n=1 Tax=Tropicibacter sp. R16_0 TaxID=2821102 RepID=UPI001ADB6CE6|nr:hypothetical protein [Tropicibacter sp. R16_0]MBO9450836.1 hypothetical protein [Tropicibacter sp. R16_0]
MRLAVYIIAGGQFLFLCLAWLEITMNPSDAAGQGMAYGFLMVGFLALAIVVVPAILLARSEKWQPLALLLAASPFLVLIWINAI